ncbi:MAG: glycosyltransferase family 2 protein [Rhodobacterales bacterium]
MTYRLFLAFALLVAAVVFPAIAALVCGVILLLQLGLMCLRPVITRFAAPRFRPTQHFSAPVFSVHVATHAEPADLVIRTLQALLDQDWPQERYEIIVMDNNTQDRRCWTPVQDFCARQAQRIRFIHRRGVQGAKAGALNIALAHTRSDASHVVTVDADYGVSPQFLSAAACALQRTGADYVQFPQSYVGVCGPVSGVDAELEEYFRSNAAVADGAEAVLLTGTLCVVSKPALIAAGGWSDASTTEDAEMGVRLCRAGYSGRFIDQVVGQGLLPFSLRDLETQRYRWCSGNFQTLLQHLRTVLTPSGPLSLHKRLVVVSQLTAWFNLAMVPTVLLLALLALGRGHTLAASLAAAVIVLSLCDVALRIIGRGLRDKLGGGVILRALACRIALAPRSARATFDAVAGGRFTFVVTDKSGTGASSRIAIPLAHLVLFVAPLLLLVVAAPSEPLIHAALLTLMLPLPAAILTDRSLRAYRHALVGNPGAEDMA